MSHVFHRTLKRPLPSIVAGDGPYLIDDTGKRYLDACGGAAVACLGHTMPEVAAAVTEQINRLSFAHTGFFTNPPAEALADYLVSRAPDGTGEGRVLYLGSGSEAMEAALKLARQYYVEKGEPERHHVIARAPSYHGNTLGALATGGHAGRRAPYAPLLMQVAHIDAAYEYRHRRDGEDETAYAHRMANQLEDKIQELGPDQVMAFVAEPVVGASLGSQPAPKGYFKRIREICDRHGVLYIADEVMCGMGRTGSTYALEQEGIAADLTTMAKGLGAGFQPIAAVLVCQKIVDMVAGHSGTLWNGHTYMSHAVATAGAMAVQNYIERNELLQAVQDRGAQLERGLRDRFGQHAHIGNIRGRGLFWSVELVADRDSKAPFDPGRGLAPGIQATALEMGLMCYPSQGCADGKAGDHVLLAPAYISTPEEINTIVALLGDAIDATLALHHS